MPGTATETEVKKPDGGISVADLERRIAEASAGDHPDALEVEIGEGEATGVDKSEGEADREAEREALSKGWTPKDKFKGPADKWVDAKTFVERGKRFNQNLQNENAALKRQLTEFKGTAEAFRKFHKETMEQRDRELDTAKADLKRALRVANREENDDLVDEIEGRITLIDQEKVNLKTKIDEVQKPTPAADAPPQLDPVLEEWLNDGNEWFRENPRMQVYSVQIGQELKKEYGEKLTGRPFLDKVREIMEQDFPEKFKPKGKTEGDEPPAQRRTIVDGAGRNTRGSGTTKTIRDLPPEDRALCLDFVKNGWTTEAAFIKSYFSR